MPLIRRRAMGILAMMSRKKGAAEKPGEDVEMAEADKRVTSAQADASVEHPAEFAGAKPGE